MAEKCMKQKMSDFISILHEKTKDEGEENPLVKMATTVNKDGETPLLSACKAYGLWDVSFHSL